MTIVQADGIGREPVTVEEFRIGVAETYDVIVRPRADRAYTIFAQAEDRSGFARGTLASAAGHGGRRCRRSIRGRCAPWPIWAWRTARWSMAARSMDHGAMGRWTMRRWTTARWTTDMRAGPTGHAAPCACAIPTSNADGVDPRSLKGKPSVDNVAMAPKDRLGEAGTGLDGNGRRVLTYRDLRVDRAARDGASPQRAIEFHLTGNMERWVWGFNGKKFSEAKAVRVKLGERIRFVLINDTMMEHPIHLHGFLFEVENGQGDRLPLKHTINVKPGERLSFVFTADEPGRWAFHCHLLYHMEMGMFRTVLVS